MREKLETIVVIIALLLLITACGVVGEMLKKHILIDEETSAVVSREERLVVLDPGHGGMDAGKIGVNGAEEKEINLDISLKIKKFLEENDISVIMIRESDERLADTQKGDLKERVRIMNEERPELVVSIHQNSYQGADVRGPQVFYYTDSDTGRSAAEMIQSELNGIEPAYSREAKANTSYYILKNSEVPVIIAECGFLSNAEEAENLINEEYQETVANAVARGIQKYIESK